MGRKVLRLLELAPPARAFRSRCPFHRKRESQPDVNGCKHGQHLIAPRTEIGGRCKGEISDAVWRPCAVWAELGREVQQWCKGEEVSAAGRHCAVWYAVEL